VVLPTDLDLVFKEHADSMNCLCSTVNPLCLSCTNQPMLVIAGLSMTPRSYVYMLRARQPRMYQGKAISPTDNPYKGIGQGELTVKEHLPRPEGLNYYDHHSTGKFIGCNPLFMPPTIGPDYIRKCLCSYLEYGDIGGMSRGDMLLIVTECKSHLLTTCCKSLSIRENP
jgi:hypothetical protein